MPIRDEEIPFLLNDLIDRYGYDFTGVFRGIAETPY